MGKPTANDLLSLHWRKLGAELPDVYDYLFARCEADGQPFVMALTLVSTCAHGYTVCARCKFPPSSPNTPERG